MNRPVYLIGLVSLLSGCSGEVDDRPRIESSDLGALVLIDGGPVDQGTSKDVSGKKDKGSTPTCGFSSSIAACQSCMSGVCGSECAACSSNSQCVQLFNCVVSCGSNTTCLSGCSSSYPGGLSAYNAFVGQNGCIAAHCQAACAGGSTPDSGTSTDPLEEARIACVNRLNAYRSQLGLPAFTRAKDKEACADTQAKNDAAHGQDHWSYLNLSPTCVLDPVYDRQAACSSWPGTPVAAAVDCVDANWKTTDDHHKYIVASYYKRVACGFHVINASTVWININYYSQ